MREYKPLSGSHRKSMRGGVVVECIARYIHEHGPSTAQAIMEGATYKNGRFLRESRYGPTTWGIRSKLMRHGAFEAITSYKDPPYKANTYGLIGSYEDYFPAGVRYN